MQRAAELAGLGERGVELLGAGDGVVAGGDHGVQRRAGAVVGVDALQVGAGELGGADVLGPQRAVDRFDGGFLDVEGRHGA